MPSFKMPVFVMNIEFKFLANLSLFPSYWQRYNSSSCTAHETCIHSRYIQLMV